MGLTYVKVFVDWLDALEEYGDAERGRLFTALMEYAKTGEAKKLSGNEKYVFPIMRNAIDRQMEEYETMCNRNSRNRAQSRPQTVTSGNDSQQVVTTRHDSSQVVTSGNDSQQEKDKDKDKDKENISNVEQSADAGHARLRSEIVDYLNLKAQTHYKPNTQATKRHVDARLNEGFTVEDFKLVIDCQCKAWVKNPNMAQYLRPETLFGSKFEGYLQNARREKNGGFTETYDEYAGDFI